MTETMLEKAAEEFEFEWDYKEHESERPPLPAFIPGKADSFIAGAKWLLEQADNIVGNKISSDSELYFALKELCEEAK